MAIMKQDFSIVLVRPEIPHNTGAIGRLCVGLGVKLHLIRPLGFHLDDQSVARAGLDYWPYLDLQVHNTGSSAYRCRASTRGASISRMPSRSPRTNATASCKMV